MHVLTNRHQYISQVSHQYCTRHSAVCTCVIMPKNVMLAVHCKQSDAVDLEAPLRQYITSNYGEREAADVNEDLVRVNLMRKDVINQAG